MMTVLAYNETINLATDHILTSIGGGAASHPDQIQMHDAHSLAYHITRLGHVFHFRFLVFEQKTTNGHMHTTRAEHTH